MTQLAGALALGIISGGLVGIAARRRTAWLGFVSLMPLAAATYALAPLLAGFAAALAGAIMTAAIIWGSGACFLSSGRSNMATSRAPPFAGAFSSASRLGSGRAMFLLGGC
jgi:hypothetical protein